MLKPVSVTSTATIAWPEDPAFDATPEEIEQCAADMVDDMGAWQKLKVKPGEKPTVFTIGVIPATVLTQYEDQCSIGKIFPHDQVLHWLCFKRGVQDITGHPPEWLYNATEIPIIDPGNGMPKHITPAWLEKHFNGLLRQCGLFIGMAVYRWQDLVGAEVKNS